MIVIRLATSIGSVKLQSAPIESFIDLESRPELEIMASSYEESDVFAQTYSPNLVVPLLPPPTTVNESTFECLRGANPGANESLSVFSLNSGVRRQLMVNMALDHEIECRIQLVHDNP